MTEYTTYMRDSVPTRVFFVDRFLLRFIDTVTSIIEFLLALRLVLHALGASDSNAFMSWLDGVTGQLIAPFTGIFPTWVLAGQFEIDLSVIFAMLAYGVIGWLLARAVVLLVGTTSTL